MAKQKYCPRCEVIISEIEIWNGFCDNCGERLYKEDILKGK